MTKPKITITTVEERLKIAKGDIYIYLIKSEDGYSLETFEKNKEFVFTGYVHKEYVKTAKVVVELLEKAISYIEEKI